MPAMAVKLREMNKHSLPERVSSPRTAGNGSFVANKEPLVQAAANGESGVGSGLPPIGGAM